MSWDVMLFNTRGQKPPPVDEFNESDFDVLGHAKEVRKKVLECLPGLDWQAPSYGVYEGDGFSIEFGLGDDDPVQSMTLFVRGSGDPVAAIIKFARPLGWSALDLTISEFIDFDNPSSAGW